MVKKEPPRTVRGGFFFCGKRDFFVANMLYTFSRFIGFGVGVCRLDFTDLPRTRAVNDARFVSTGQAVQGKAACVCGATKRLTNRTQCNFVRKKITTGAVKTAPVCLRNYILVLKILIQRFFYALQARLP